MNFTMFTEYFRAVFNSKNYKLSHGLPQLFTVNGVAAIVSHYVLHDVPTQDQLERLLTVGFEENDFLLCTVTFGLILLLACLSNPCHPIVQFTIDFVYYFVENFLTSKIRRQLYPWEEGAVLFIIHIAVMYLYRPNFSRAALARKFVYQVAKQVVGRMVIFALDQYVLKDKVQLYVMMLLGYGQVYGELALGTLREQRDVLQQLAGAR